MTALAFSLELDGREVDVQIGAADTTADYTLDMESTAPLVIALQDQQRKLLQSGICPAVRRLLPGAFALSSDGAAALAELLPALLAQYDESQLGVDPDDDEELSERKRLTARVAARLGVQPRAPEAARAAAAKRRAFQDESPEHPRP